MREFEEMYRDEDERLADLSPSYRGIPWAYELRGCDIDGSWRSIGMFEELEDAEKTGEKNVNRPIVEHGKAMRHIVDWVVKNHRGEVVSKRVWKRLGANLPGWGSQEIREKKEG